MIKKLFIHKEALDYPLTRIMAERLDIPQEIIDGAGDLFREISSSKDPVQKAKEILFLTRNRGAFIKKCPGTGYYTCCDYVILNIGSFCTMDCSYCILQSYFHPPVLQFFVNQERMLREMDRMFREKEIHRIGTGEFTDSMIWEWMTDLSSILVPRFAGQKSAVLELKTKTVNIEAMEEFDHNGKTIMAWSVNTPKVIKSEERRTTTLLARLKAAAKCQSLGYPLAFHFDPMVIYEGCEEEYLKVVDEIFAHVSPNNVVWISIGTFRFIPTLKQIIRTRFPHSKIPYGEFIQGMDGKMRYFKPLRIKLYKKVADRIREIAPDTTVYFCMEDDEVWEKSFGFLPSDRGGLPHMLDMAAVKHCNIRL